MVETTPTDDKEENLQISTRKKDIFHAKEKYIRVDFSRSNNKQERGGSCCPRILYPAKVSLQRKKAFSNIQKLKEFSSSMPAMPAMCSPKGEGQ